MNNFGKEVLDIVIQKLQSKVKANLLKISVILGDTKNTDAVNLVENILYDLDKDSGALAKAEHLKSQFEEEENTSASINRKMEELANLVKTKNEGDINLTD